MRGSQLRQALHAGKRVYGTSAESSAPKWAAQIAQAGVDFVFIDTEHLPRDRALLAWLCQVYTGLDVAPVVRVPEPNPYLACMARDAGAHGVIFPYVESVQETLDLAGAVKYRPLKGDKLAQALAGAELPTEVRDYLEQYNRDGVVVINIESVTAMEHLPELLASPLIDAVLIGPHDLSISLGLPEQWDHPRFDEAVRYIIKTARAKSVGAGIHYSYSIQQEVGWAQAGANLILHSSDISLMSHTLKQDMAYLREALLDQPGKAPSTSPGDTAVV